MRLIGSLLLAGLVVAAAARELARSSRPSSTSRATCAGGCVVETYGENPLLASVMGRAFISAFEQSGVVTSPKHFVANVGEGGRDSYPIDLSSAIGRVSDCQGGSRN